MGVIIKGSKHLEALGQVKTFVFDKTGTLTTGSLEVTGVFASSEYSEKEVLEAAFVSGVRSLHPLSKAVFAYAKRKGTKERFPDFAEEKGGKGILVKIGEDSIAMGKKIFLEEIGMDIPNDIIEKANEETKKSRSVSFVAKNGKVVGIVAASDKIKNNAAETIADLRALGVQKIVMLTGDNSQVAEITSKKLGVDEWYAELMPEDKVEVIRHLEKEGLVAMVGDGVNDAAALSIANVGIAMGGLGAEGTIDSAQIVLMRDDLSALPETMRISRAIRRISIQDFWIWGMTNVVGLILVLCGIIGPSGAAAYNFLSDFLPLSNSIRIKIKKAR